MGLESFRPESLSINEALAAVRAKRAEAAVMGANDFEPSAFNAIETELMEGKISPKEATERAGSIVDSKQDYH